MVVKLGLNPGYLNPGFLKGIQVIHSFVHLFICGDSSLEYGKESLFSNLSLSQEGNPCNSPGSQGKSVATRGHPCKDPQWIAG